MNDFWKSYDITTLNLETITGVIRCMAASTSQNWLFRLHSLEEWLGGIAAALPAPGGVF